MHLAPLIQDLAVILAAAAVVSFIFHRIRQPVVLGYIIAGIVIGPYTFPYSLITDLPNVKIWAELGVIFLMFSLGLEFSFRKLARVGTSPGTTAAIEITGMFMLGWLAGQLLGWSTLESIFLGSMISISSTTIIFKALEELNLKKRRSSEIIFGILIFEDLVAILLIVALSSFVMSNTVDGVELFRAVGQLLFVVTLWFLIGYFFIPRFVKPVGDSGSKELLLILSIALCLGLVSVSAFFGYSVALGAFIMGSILAETGESSRIEHLIQPLRDLFVAVFFVSVGMLINPTILTSHIGTIATITGILVFGKISLITLGNVLSGQPLRIATQVSFGMAQIGEFSFILATLGLSLGVLKDHVYGVVVAVSLLTTLLTPQLIRMAEPAGNLLEKKLPKRLLLGLERYSAWIQRRQADIRQKSIWLQLGLKWASSAVLVIAIFSLMGHFGLPFLSQYFQSPILVDFLGWTLATLLAAPFIWGMFFAFRTPREPSQRRKSDQLNPNALLVGRFFTIFTLALMSLPFFSPLVVLLLTILTAFAYLFVFYRQLETSYHWIEKQFLETFKNSQRRKTDSFKHLAPWSAHLVKSKVHPNSSMVGKKLSELKLREQYGLTLVVIERGSEKRVAPVATDRIFPHDELYFFGTDEQIELIRTAFETAPKRKETPGGGNYELHKILLKENSKLNGKRIKDLRIQTRYGVLIVGIERAGERITNPKAILELKGSDLLWVIGELTALKRFSNAL